MKYRFVGGVVHGLDLEVLTSNSVVQVGYIESKLKMVAVPVGDKRLIEYVRELYERTEQDGEIVYITEKGE